MAVPPSFPTTTFTPVTAVNLNLGVGSSAGQRQKKLLMLGVGLAAGSKAAGTISEVFTGEEADEYFGAGSSLARMCRSALDRSRGLRIFGAFVADAAGTAAQATLTVTGTASAASTLLVGIARWVVTVAIPASTAQNDAATLIYNAIIAHPQYDQFPLTAAAPVANILTVTTKELNVESTDQVTNMWVDTSKCYTTAVALNTGATAGAGALDISTVLTASISEVYDYYVTRTTDSTNGGLLEAHLDTYIAPLEGQRQRGIVGSMDTPGNVNTLSQAINARLVEVMYCEKYLSFGYECAAMAAADWAYLDSFNPASPIKYYPLKSIAIPHLSSEYMTKAECETALHSGVTPLIVRNGEATVARRVTSRSLTAGGSPDTTSLDAHHVSIAFAMADEIEVDFETRFMKEDGIAFKVMDNPAAGVQPPAFTATPNLVRDAGVEWLWTWYDRGWISDPSSYVDEVAASIDSVDTSRINLTIPPRTINGLMVTDISLNQQAA